MIDELLDRIAAFHRNRNSYPEFPMVAEVVDALETARVPASFEPTSPLTVLRHLERVESSGDPGVDAVLEEFVRIAPDLPWRRTVGYFEHLSADYMANYGYVQLLGPPPSIIEHDSVRVGVGLWGPNLEYPLHHHEAEELYHVLAGTPAFGSRGGAWRSAGPGDAVHNAPWQRHAQRFGPTPTVLLYCWTGAVHADAMLVQS